MIPEPLQRTLEATGYLLDGRRWHAAPGVSLAGDPAPPRLRSLSPDAWWRPRASVGSNGNAGASNLTVLFKFTDRPDGGVADWQRDVWNLGFAPLLWVVSPDRTEIYNGFGAPQPQGEVHRNRLRTFHNTPAQLDDLNSYAGRLVMETGQFWRRSTRVNRKTGVDTRLLEHLGALKGDLVAERLDPLEAQGLIGRTVFAKYLLDREIVGPQELRDLCGYDDLPEILGDRAATQRLFDWLRTTFNGDMFPANLQAPAVGHLRQVASFLRADDPAGQMSLFPYRFDVIPVELISSIYERFVHQSAGIEQATEASHPKKMGVYYTPLTVVSMVLDEVFDGLTGDETVIDLTCGSGVFLVEALRRLVRLKADGGTPTREMVRHALYKQVYGIDLSEPAIRIAAFSLYLAALELDPDPRESRSRAFEPLMGRTLLSGNAHAIEETVDGARALTTEAGLRKFDVVVGNPPWGYRGRSGTAARRDQVAGSSLSPRGESLDFVRRGGDFAHSRTRFGLIVSARPFFARSETGLQAVQETIQALGSVTLVNLSDLSHWLFERANMPAMALIAGHRRQNGDTMELVHLPRSPETDRSRTLGVPSADSATLPFASWKRNQDLFKASFIGGQHDLLLLDSLADRHAPLGARLSQLETAWAAGLTIGDRSRDASFLTGLPFAARGMIGRFKVPGRLRGYQGSAQWPRRRDIYRSPLLLVGQNLPGERESKLAGRMVAAVADRDIVYTEAYLGVSFARANSDVAYLLAGILSSCLTSWYVTMAASNFGVWKRSVRVADVKSLPVPDLEWATGTDTGLRLVGLIRRFHEAPPDDGDWRALDDAVCDLYELDREDRIIVADGRLRATWQWAAGRHVADREAGPRQLRGYARAFLLSMDAWLHAGNERRFRAEIYDTGPASPLRVVRFVLEDDPPPSRIVLRPKVALADLLRDIDKRLGVSIARELVGTRELRVHARREVVIVKPAARRHWLGAAGLDDARAVLVKSFGGRDG